MAEEIGALRAVLALESAAFDKGVASARRQLTGLGGGFQKAGGQVVQFGSRMRDIDRASRAGSGGLQNIGFQVQDFAVQVGAGTSASQALAQQLPQLLSGFGMLGIALGTASAILIPFASYLFSASEEAVTLEDSLKSLGAAMGALDSASKAAAAPAEDLLATYGEFADQAQQLALINREIAYLNASTALSTATGTMSDLFGELERVNVAGQQVPEWLAEVEAKFGTLNPNAVNEVAEALKITEQQAILLTEQMVLLRDAEGPEAQAEALRNVIEQLDLATRGTVESEAAARGFKQQLAEAYGEALKLAAIDLVTPVAMAADEAGRLQRNLSRLAYGKIQNTGEGGADQAARQAIANRPDPFGSLDRAANSRAAGVYVAPRGGGGGGGTSEAQKEANELQREAARVFAQTRTEAEKYGIELGKLNTLLAAGEISQDTFNRAVDDLKDKAGEAGSAAASMESAFSSAFGSFVTGAESAQEAVSNLLDSLANTLANEAFSALSKGLFGDGGIGGAVAGAFGLNANGNAFSNGRVTAFASGGIVNSPTVFPMANGAGLMGEAGPEAIMPLTRIGGKLGVRTSGGGGTVVNIDARGAVEGTAAQIDARLRQAMPDILRQSVSANRAAGARGY
jgi:hypothetical protein